MFNKDLDKRLNSLECDSIRFSSRFKEVGILEDKIDAIMQHLGIELKYVQGHYKIIELNTIERKDA